MVTFFIDYIPVSSNSVEGVCKGAGIIETADDDNCRVKGTDDPDVCVAVEEAAC